MTSYRDRAAASIRGLVENHECQPILFVGSGLSRRYFGAPTWHDALRGVLNTVKDGGKPYEYYAQVYSNDPIKIGSALAERVHTWAWGKGKPLFPDNLFQGQFGTDIFLKHQLAESLTSIMPTEAALLKSGYAQEISALKSVRPNAIITTNFDELLEAIFDGYEPIVGESVLRYNTNSFGEIFQIHGSVADLQSMILTERDYSEFLQKKKYISAKLLTYFAEHPVFILGYSFNDPNVSAILSDVGEIVADSTGTIDNVFYVQWEGELKESANLPEQQIISSSDGKEYRVRAVVADDFQWVFEAMTSNAELKHINPKLVRALAARAYKLIRSDIPKGTFEVDYDVLERVASNSDELPTLLGITPTGNSNMTHPYSLSQVAEALGFERWNSADVLLKKVFEDKGVDLRATDNKYHCQIKSGKKSAFRKWSAAAVDLLEKVREDNDYSVQL